MRQLRARDSAVYRASQHQKMLLLTALHERVWIVCASRNFPFSDSLPCHTCMIWPGPNPSRSPQSAQRAGMACSAGHVDLQFVEQHKLWDPMPQARGNCSTRSEVVFISMR